MARAFVRASSQYIRASGTPVTATPFTMACWARTSDDAEMLSCMWVGDASVDNQWWNLAFAGFQAGDPVTLYIKVTAGQVGAFTTTGYSLNTWHHLCGVAASSTDRRVFIDGGSRGNNTADGTPTGVDRLTIGAIDHTSVGEVLDGQVAECAVWDRVFSDAEVADLAKGFSPLFYFPENLVFYSPGIRDDRDLSGGLTLTPFNSPTVVAHPQIIRPAPKYYFSPLAAAPPAGPSAGLRTLSLTGIGI